MREINAEALEGKVLERYEMRSGTLALWLVGDPEELRLRCRMGRCHWLVHSEDRPEGSSLTLVCHCCGQIVRLPLASGKAGKPA